MVRAFLKKHSDCVTLDGSTTRKPERFKNMIHRFKAVCQEKNTRPEVTGIYVFN